MTTQAVAIREATKNTVAKLRDPSFVQRLEAATPEGVTGAQIAEAAALAVLQNEDLAKPALLQSLFLCAMLAASDGLRPDGHESAFIIRKVKGQETVTYLPMIGGYVKYAAKYGWTLTTACIYENDVWEPDYDGSRTGRITAGHVPPRPGQPRGELIGAYALARHRDGRVVFDPSLVMSKADIDKVRASSPASQRGPWVDWYERMAEKTPGRRAFKKLPLDPADERVSRLLFHDDSPEAAISALYGPEGQIIEHRPAGELISSPPDGDADTAAGEGDADGKRRSGANSPAATSDEPSDDELEALGADDEPVEGEVVDEDVFRFRNGKYGPGTEVGGDEGATVREVYESDGRGRGYIKWASENWRDDDERDVIAAEYETLRGED